MKSKRKDQEKKKGSPERLRVFDRQQIAEIVGIPHARVRNWSMGKPFMIEPSVRAPGKRGSANLYTLADVHLFGIVARLSEIGIKPEFVKMVIFWVQSHPQVLDRKWKGMVTIFIPKGQRECRVHMFEGEPGPGTPDSAWFLSKSKTKPLSAGVIFVPREVQKEIDERIAKLEKEGKL